MDWRKSCYRTADVDRGSDGDEVEAAAEEEEKEIIIAGKIWQRCFRWGTTLDML